VLMTILRCFVLCAVCETTVALVVRKSNPRNVRTWEDLLQQGLQVCFRLPHLVAVLSHVSCSHVGSDGCTTTVGAQAVQCAMPVVAITPCCDSAGKCKVLWSG
jgi:hypothetical protein